MTERQVSKFDYYYLTHSSSGASRSLYTLGLSLLKTLEYEFLCQLSIKLMFYEKKNKKRESYAKKKDQLI